MPRLTTSFTPRLTTALLVAAVAAGCTVGPRHETPRLTLPERFAPAAPDAGVADAAADAAASLADRPWWDLVDDPALARLIDEALAHNHDLRLAAWRLEEARAAAGIAGAERWPVVSAGAGWSRGRSAEAVAPGGVTDGFYDARLGISWEVDLWGRLRHLDAAARARHLAAGEARRGVVLALVAEVASSYFELRALDLQIEIAQRSLDAFVATHELFEHRLAAGLASGLETASAEASLAATAARIPDLERRRAAQEDRLSLLVGRFPGEMTRGAALDRQALPPDVPAGLPADLLRRRPDLRQAEQELVAANAEVGVAVAELFPSLRLTGVFGGLAPEVADLFASGKTWSVGGGLLAPLVQGRRLENQRAAAVARWEQAKVRYEARVHEAFAEVASALVAYERLSAAEVHQTRAVAAQETAVRLATSRYRSGLADYLEVLDAQRQLFPAETALAEIRLARLTVLVDLYRALGGGWSLADGDWRRGEVAP